MEQRALSWYMLLFAWPEAEDILFREWIGAAEDPSATSRIFHAHDA